MRKIGWAMVDEMSSKAEGAKQTGITVDRSAPVYSIGAVAEKTELSRSTIRAWERMDLIEPSRTPGGHRRFSRDDVDRIRAIRGLLDEGVSLSAVPAILRNRSDESLEDHLRTLSRMSRQ